MSAAGVELIIRCDQAAPRVLVYQPPTRDQVEAQLVDEQLSIMSRRYLRDLRRDADVETR
jgi:peptidyl-prolyl cis-trans isomerase SurA